MVQPAEVWAGLPLGAVKTFSVEKDGQVVRRPSLPGVSQARRNSAAPLRMG